MKKKGVVISMVVLLLFVVLSGCQETSNQNGNQTTNNSNGNQTGNPSNGDQQQNTTDNEFLGDWKVIDIAPNHETWTFYANHSAKDYLIQESDGESSTTISWFYYTKDNTTLCFLSNGSPDSPDYFSICYSYLFSDNATRLTFSSNGIVIIDLIKMHSE